jgi:hypothetical protein
MVDGAVMSHSITLHLTLKKDNKNKLK